MEQPETLSVQASDAVRMQEVAMDTSRKRSPTGGTLHITGRDGAHRIVEMAWELSESSNLPVVVVVRIGDAHQGASGRFDLTAMDRSQPIVDKVCDLSEVSRSSIIICVRAPRSVA